MVLSKWIFANLYNLLSNVVEPKVRPYRILTAGQCHGRVLEIGAGTGANLALLPDDADVSVVEPDKFMRSKLITKTEQLGIDVQVFESKGENLALPSNSFDCVFTTLVLCMVDDVEKVLAEAYRVLKPGGKFYFYEHVASDSKLGIAIQGALSPFWRWATTGCHLNRDIELSLSRIPFAAVNLETFDLSLIPGISIPNIVGHAVK